MSRNQLIIQLPFLSPDDWDTLLDVEETLIQAFSQNNVAMVDGHDEGQEKFNIFIFPKGAWAPVLERVYACLKLRGVLHKAIIAKQLKASGRVVVVWPEGFAGKFEV
jgi:hypothetical protein